jgi:predicted transcriptional regulator
MDLAAPIVAATIAPVSDPDAMLEYEPWQSQEVPIRQRIIDFMNGRAMTARQIEDGTGISRHTLNNNLRDTRSFEVVGTIPNTGPMAAARPNILVYRAIENPYIPIGPGAPGLQDNTLEKVSRLVEYIREHGDITLSEASAYIETDPGTLRGVIRRTTLLSSYRTSRNRYVTLGGD